MKCKTADWICGGFRAERPDGETVFVYRRLDWSPSRYTRAYSAYEFRWRGLAAGLLTTESGWRKRARILYTLDDPGTSKRAGPAGNSRLHLGQSGKLRIPKALRCADLSFPGVRASRAHKN